MVNKNYLLLLFFILVIILTSLNSRNKNIDLSKYEKYQVTIYRDTWGVPHIFGNKDEDTAYGLGYAHAEDDFDTIQNILIAARGDLAKFHGKSAAANDYMVQLLKIWDIVETNYDKGLSTDVIRISEAYADGINHFISLNPDLAYKGTFPINGKDIIAGFIHRMPLMFGLDRVLGELASSQNPNKKVQISKSDSKLFEQKMLGSNVVAVAPNRSSDNHTRILINSHQPWTGPVAWYEAHLNSNEGWNMIGGLFPGSPVVFVGHNENIGWSHTVNNPDLIDVYELEINPDNPDQYYFDGQYENLEISEAKIKVKIWGPIKWTFKRKIFRSKHGPVIRNDHGSFAIRYAGHDEFRYLEQWFRMNKSKDLKDFENAMKIMAIPMFNTIYADKKGNIFYLYNALLPQRKNGFEWSGNAINGTSSINLWTDYLSYDELPKILNPQSGFLQNCNSSPFLTTTGNDNPDTNLYQNNLGIERFQTNRALRAHELYGADKSITREEFYNYKYDTKYSEKSVLTKNLKRFLTDIKSNDIEINNTIEILKDWNYDTDSLAVGVQFAIDAIRPVYNPDNYIYDYDLIMNRLKDSITRTKNEFGKLDVKWGDIQRLDRGNTNLALSGGPDILRAIYSNNKGGYKKAVAGDCYFQIVEWSPSGKVSSQSIHQFGSATQDFTSAHYDDQAHLFAKNKMKPIWINLKDIKLNLVKSYSPGSKEDTKE